MTLTPMMQQYFQVKEKCKDCILFYRLGDFYEMFFEDAEIASKELELVLTGRDCGLENRAPMCGIPYHAANNYISRLVSKGYKIAIGEQLEEASAAKGIVRRDIIKIITPGTYMDSSFLEENKNNYIMSIFIDKANSQCSLSFADLTTGEFYTTDFQLSINKILDEISKFHPKEILIQDELDEEIVKHINARIKVSYTSRADYYFTNDAEENIKAQFKNTTNIYKSCVFNSANGILNYILETQKFSLSNFIAIDYYSVEEFMNIDINSRMNLEITESIREKSKKGSLLGVIDKTATAMGSRMLRKWLEQPLLNKTLIELRLNAVDELKNSIGIQEELREALSGVYDIERILGKISAKAVNAKELISLKASISKLPGIKAIAGKFNSELIKKIYNNLDDLKDIFDILENSLLDSPALSIKEGNIIKDGYNKEIDELRQAKTHGKEWIAALENQEREISGIRSLKVGYNKVFGYYIEISKANYTSIPEGRYIRKQTLANAERYITEELKVMEEKILGAEERLINLEYDLFINIRDEIEIHTERMKNCARLVSELDCLCSLATVALENNYIKPIINDEGFIDIKEGRHPVVEKMLPKGNFISNNTNINSSEEQLILITGPNMAGKSTYMRQVALITVLAQIGSFVPAEYASISICDKIFTRIGASDDLSSGKSTFMVEMWEVANILNNATQRSLILLDEVGRGTSTYDGLSIAWAVIEFICNSDTLKCKTLFATHYHELTKLEGLVAGVKNYSVAVKELGNDIVFLRKIVKGGADQSYGIEVAKLAGLPEALINRAKEILSNLENSNERKDKLECAIDNITNVNETTPSQAVVQLEQQAQEKVDNKITKKSAKHSNMIQVDFMELERNSFIKDIGEIDLMNLTPMESMNKLYELIKKAKCL